MMTAFVFTYIFTYAAGLLLLLIMLQEDLDYPMHEMQPVDWVLISGWPVLVGYVAITRWLRPAWSLLTKLKDKSK